MKRILVFLFFFSSLSLLAQEGPVVAVTGGQIQGFLASDGGAAFKGIPFAQPPLGKLRWRAPQPVEPWQGIRRVTQFSPACTQLSEGWNEKFVQGSREDCLYLNVATPAWPPHGKLPVMVWIHGGSNTAGDADDAGFDERTLVRRGIVLVTINYRLGQLGFLVNSELDSELPHHTSGNYGLMDQIAALHWVQENIGTFGGDPGQVTVFGESAGAYDISLLMTSPLADGLFARAVAESGAPSGFLRSRTKAYAENIGKKLASQVKAPKQGTIAFLRTLPAAEILRQTQIATNNDRVGLETSVDGWVLPESPERAYARGKSMAIPLILGSNGQEFAPPADPAKLNELLEDGYGALADRARQMYGLVGAMPQSDPIYGAPQAQLATDVQFRCPALEQAIGHSAAGHATYLYEFDHSQPGQQYTSHNSELRFLFGVWEPGTQLRPIDQKISDQMQSYWINLARTGDPNGDGLPAWPKFQDHSREYMVFTDDGAQVKKNVRHNYCDLWLQAHEAH